MNRFFELRRDAGKILDGFSGYVVTERGAGLLLVAVVAFGVTDDAKTF